MFPGHHHATIMLNTSYFVSHVPGGTEVLPAATHKNQLKHNPDSDKLLGDVRDTLSFLWFVLETGLHTMAHAGPKLISVSLPQPPKC